MSRPGPRPWRWKGPTIGERLESLSMPEPNSGCLLHMGADTGLGYIRMSWHGKPIKAHRLAWIGAYGPIPDGLHVLHKCDVRCCVNPKHLWLGTNEQNNADMYKKGRARHAAGERAGSPLRESQVRSIRADPRSCKIVGPEFGISDTACYNIRNRKTWKHVP